MKKLLSDRSGGLPVIFIGLVFFLLVAAFLVMETGAAFERYYAEDRGAYYDALRSVRRNTLNMESWLEYFLTGLADEYERIATTVSDLSQLVGASGPDPLRLSATQERALTRLRIEGRREFSRRDYENASGLGRSAAGGEIAELARHGILIPRGAGTAARYAFSSPPGDRAPGGRPRRGRKPTWTDAAIEAELRSFLDGRSSWPTRDEFSAAGKLGLYSAASRRGTIGRWRAHFGL